MKNIIEAAHDYKEYVFLETRKANGSEHFQELLYAIKNKKAITFNHYKYWEDIIRERTVHGLALKEAKGRWYLIAIDLKDNKLKTFGLDRMSDLVISKTSFRNKYDFNIRGMFKNAFGIHVENKMPEKIQLSFDYEQGQYVKNHPLHHSQNTISESENVLIELYICISYDFVMELLSYGEYVTILSPKHLIKQVKQIAEKAVKKYQ